MSFTDRIFHDFITYVVLGGVIYKGLSELLKRFVLKPLWMFIKKVLIRTEQHTALFVRYRHKGAKKQLPAANIGSDTM